MAACLVKHTLRVFNMRRPLLGLCIFLCWRFVGCSLCCEVDFLGEQSEFYLQVLR